MKRLFALILTLAVAASLAACNAKPDRTTSSPSSETVSASGESSNTPEEDPSSEQEPVSEEETPSAEEPSSTDGGAEETSASMEEFIASISDQIDQLSGSMDGMGTLEVIARGNSLVYQFQYTMDLGDTSVIQPMLEQTMDTLTSTFESIYDVLKLAVPDAQSLVVEYLDKDGNMLVYREYN